MKIKYILLIIVLCVFIYYLYYSYYLYKISYTEGFTWNNDTIAKFFMFQNYINSSNVYDMNILQQQASEAEANYLLLHHRWPWNEHTKKKYIKANERNTYTKDLPLNSLNDAMKIYNENAILDVLFQESKEGQMLINGIWVPSSTKNIQEELPSGYGNFGYNSGLIENRTKDLIKCNNDGYLERITYTGKNRNHYGQQTEKKSILNYMLLENLIPGFTFLKGPCNPCMALNPTLSSSQYKCPFNIKVKLY